MRIRSVSVSKVSIHEPGTTDWLTIVGVVKDTRSGGLEKEPFSQIYEPQSQRGDQIGSLVVRTAGEPQALAASVRTLLRNLNRSVAISLVATMEQLLERQELQRRLRFGWRLCLRPSPQRALPRK